MSEDISNVHLMMVDKFFEALLNTQPSVEDFDQEMIGFESEDTMMSDNEEIVDLMTLTQYQLGFQKEAFVWKVPQSMLTSQKKGRIEKGVEKT